MYSEKMAALEVVYNRLRAVGLGDYCLELHSHKANKRAVVQELKRCLEEKKSAASPVLTEQMEKLDQRRQQLTNYVHALHHHREPLDRSVWWALGELVHEIDLGVSHVPMVLRLVLGVSLASWILCGLGIQWFSINPLAGWQVGVVAAWTVPVLLVSIMVVEPVRLLLLIASLLVGYSVLISREISRRTEAALPRIVRRWPAPHRRH